MKILVLDSETQGFPLYKEPSEDPRQPHIVELAALLYDDATGELVDQMHAIVRPDGWTIPDEVAAIHGITTERAMDEGRPEHEVLAEALALHATCALRVAHNESFDQRIMRIAIKRFGDGLPGWNAYTQEHKDAIADAFKAAPAFCTMRGTHAVAKAAGASLKWPASMRDAHQHFLGQAFEGAHSARADAEACARVYFAMNPVAAVA